MGTQVKFLNSNPDIPWHIGFPILMKAAESEKMLMCSSGRGQALVFEVLSAFCQRVSGLRGFVLCFFLLSLNVLLSSLDLRAK